MTNDRSAGPPPRPTPRPGRPPTPPPREGAGLRETASHRYAGVRNGVRARGSRRPTSWSPTVSRIASESGSVIPSGRCSARRSWLGTRSAGRGRLAIIEGAPGGNVDFPRPPARRLCCGHVFVWPRPEADESSVSTRSGRMSPWRPALARQRLRGRSPAHGRGRGRAGPATAGPRPAWRARRPRGRRWRRGVDDPLYHSAGVRRSPSHRASARRLGPAAATTAGDHHRTRRRSAGERTGLRQGAEGRSGGGSRDSRPGHRTARERHPRIVGDWGTVP